MDSGFTLSYLTAAARTAAARNRSSCARCWTSRSRRAPGVTLAGPTTRASRVGNEFVVGLRSGLRGAVPEPAVHRRAEAGNLRITDSARAVSAREARIREDLDFATEQSDAAPLFCRGRCCTCALLADRFWLVGAGAGASGSPVEPKTLSYSVPAGMGRGRRGGAISAKRGPRPSRA